MNGIEINLTVLVIAWMAASLFMVVLAVVAIRFGLVPALGAIAAMRGTKAGGGTADLTRRMSQMERRLGALERAAGGRGGRDAAPDGAAGNEGSGIEAVG